MNQEKTLQDIFTDYLRCDQTDTAEVARAFAKRAATTPAEDKYNLVLNFMATAYAENHSEDSRARAKYDLEAAFKCEAEDGFKAKLDKAGKFLEKIAKTFPPTPRSRPRF